MASGTEGIALLSMYNDEEEEDDDEQVEEPAAVSPTVDGDGEGFAVDRALPDPQDSVADGTPPGINSLSPLPSEVATDPKTLEKSSPMPPSSRTSSPFMSVSPYPSPIPTPIPPQPPASSAMEAVDRPRARRGALAIVDYAHDEAAMSPEAEEGEIASGGRVMFGSDIQASDGNLEEGTTPGSVQILTPSTQPEPPQSSDVPEQSKSETSMAMDLTVTAPEVAQLDVAADASIDTQNDDQLNSFLPPPLTTWCSEELQEKINKFLAYKRAGKSFNADLRNRKDYRNPDFLQHAVRYQDIDQIGTCFSKEVFDPHGYDKSDYYDEIEADLKREIEKKEQEKKRSQKLDFVSVGMQSVNIAPALKVSTQIPASVTSGLQSVSTAVDSITKEIRQNKKTKWDKIDGDVKNPSNSGGHDNLSAVGVHASHLSAANAGTGYTAFAQQKRREAEEKRSGERKFDKRS